MASWSGWQGMYDTRFFLKNDEGSNLSNVTKKSIESNSFKKKFVWTSIYLVMLSVAVILTRQSATNAKTWKKSGADNPNQPSRSVHPRLRNTFSAILLNFSTSVFN